MKKILIIIAAIVALGVVSIVGFIGYMGLFSEVTVVEKNMGPYVMVYDSFVGPYQDTAAVFDKVYKAMEEKGISTELGIGVYYDDPAKVPADKLRSDCGVVLPQKNMDRLEELKQTFKVKTLKAAPSLVVDFPIKNSLSYMMGPIKAYPALSKHVESKGKTFDTTYELYDVPKSKIHFVATTK